MACGAGREEVDVVRRTLEATVFPKLRSHQKVLLIPGLFGCSNSTYLSLSEADGIAATKLAGYAAFIKSEPRIAGMVGWHFNDRKPSPQQPGHPCDMSVGLTALPKSLAAMREIVGGARLS